MRLFRSNCLVASFCLIIFGTILAAEGRAQTVAVSIVGQVNRVCPKWVIFPDGHQECPFWVTNYGSVTLTVNGISVTAAVASVETTGEQMATQLAQGINASVPNVSAAASQRVVYITPQNPFTFTITSSSFYFNHTLFGGPPFTGEIHLPDSGTINPKFLVLAVTYAPPGQNSSVNYGSSTMLGTSSSMTDTFKEGNTISVELTTGFSIFGFGGSTVAAASHAYTQQSDTTSTVAVNKTSSSSFTIPGPASSTVGIDHDNDVIWVWLNPQVHVTITPSDLLQWNGFSYDARDPANEMEVVPLYVKWLKNPETIPANVAAVLARTWDPSGLGGLTNEDYAEILKCNPFSNPSYVPDPARFDLQGGQTFTFQPPPAGGQPITQTHTLTYQTTTSNGTSGESSHKVGFSMQKVFEGNFLARIKLKLKDENTLEWTDKWSNTSNTMAGQTASLTIRGPAYSDNYTGPTQIQVYKDNVYGTFMFYPVNH